MKLGTQELAPEKIKARAEEKGISEEEARAELENEMRSALEERAQAEGKSVEELIAEEEELTGLVNKYNSDPLKMAKALKSSAQEATRLIERQRILESELEQLKTQVGSPNEPKDDASKIRQQMVADMKSRHPTLDDDVIEAMVDEKIEILRTAQSFYYTDKAKDKIEIEKKELNDATKYPFYKRFKAEIDKLIDAQPIQVKMSPGIVKRCYDNVVGAHIMELKEEFESKRPSEPEEVNVIPSPKRRTSSITPQKTGTLTPRQAQEMERLGLSKTESYLSILKKHRERAKRDGLPEPELLSDPWYKK